MVSVEFQELKDAFLELKAELMNFSLESDGTFSKESLLKCQAFVVFTHAEIETYLERSARRILDAARLRWESALIPDRVIGALLAYRRHELTGVPADPKDPSRKSNIKEIVTASIKIQEGVIADNNGIKRSNLSELFSPLGIFDHEFDEVLLIKLDSTGKSRGNMVHRSTRVSLQTIRDPFADELRAIQDLVDDMEGFDLMLERIYS